MRVCHIVRQFHPSVGGLESFVLDLAREQMALGCDCTVLTLNRLFNAPSVQLPAEEDLSGLRVQRVPMLGHPRFFLPVIPREKLMPFDVLHVHGIDGMFDRLARHPRRPGQALIATSHGGFFHTPWMRTAKELYFRTITRMSLKQYDLCLANSEQDKRLLQVVSDNVALLPNGVRPLGSFVADGADLLSLGRLATHKKIDRLLRLVAEAPLRDTHLHVVGAEWDVKIADLLQLASSLGVADRVTFHGGLNQAALQRVARRCGVFVSASQYEGFGMSMIEAMSVGLIPVVEGNGSFRELIGRSPVGCIAAFASPAQAAATVRRQLDSLKAEKRRAAITFAADYSWRAHAERTLEYYGEALSQSALAIAA